VTNLSYWKNKNRGEEKVETGRAIRTIREARSFSHIAISPDGRRFVTASSGEGNRILLWDLATGAYRESRGHTGSVSSLAFSPDGNYFISGSSDKTIRIWSADTGQEIRILTEHTGNGDIGRVLSVSYSPDERQIVFDILLSGPLEQLVQNDTPVQKTQTVQSSTTNQPTVALGKIEQKGTTFTAFDLSGKEITHFSSPNSQLLGWGSDFFVIRSGTTFKTYDVRCRQISSVSVGGATTASVEKEIFTVKAGSSTFKYDKRCKRK
jgi:WD40 repeat protein